MSVPVFRAPTGVLDADEIHLDGDEGRHAAVVRRIAAGESVELTDGRGLVAQCVVAAADRHGLTCVVHSRRQAPRPQPRIVVVQAIPKGDRAEAAVEAMTEVGVDEIIPWTAARCVVRWRDDDRAAKALRRWRTTAREAAKQSRRSWWPTVGEPVTTAALAGRVRAAAAAIVLHEAAERPLISVPLPENGDILLVVGPEGGLTPDETAQLGSAGATIARLGPTVLRTSTAGTVAAGIVLSRTPRWSDRAGG